jgi:hypothetical protein
LIDLTIAAEHERHDRRAHTLCPGRRQGAWHQARQSKASRDQSGEGGRQAQALRLDIERWIAAGRMSSSAITTDLNARRIAAPNGGQRFRMQVRRVRDRLGP